MHNRNQQKKDQTSRIMGRWEDSSHKTSNGCAQNPFVRTNLKRVPTNFKLVRTILKWVHTKLKLVCTNLKWVHTNLKWVHTKPQVGANKPHEGVQKLHVSVQKTQSDLAHKIHVNANKLLKDGGLILFNKFP